MWVAGDERARPFEAVALAIGYGLLYFALNEVGVQLALPPAGFSVFWPAAGLALTAFLVVPYRLWWALALGQAAANCIGNLAHGTELDVTVWFVVANLVESAGGAAAIRWARARTMESTRSRRWAAIGFVGLFANTMVAALIAAAALVWVLDVPGGFVSAWRTWWVADAVGILAVAPMLLFWRSERSSEVRRRLPEFVAAIAAAWGCTLVLFLQTHSDSTRSALVYLLVPVLLWPALRLGRSAAATAFAGTIVIAVSFTSKGRGPFAHLENTALDNALDVQLFFSVLGASILVVAYAVELMRRAERAAGMATIERDERGRLEVLLDETERLGLERERLLGRAQLLAEVSAVLDEALAVDAQLARLSEVLSQRLRAWCGIDLIVDDASGQLLSPRAQSGPFRIETHTRSVRLDRPVAAAIEGEPVLLNDITEASINRRATDPERLRVLTDAASVSAIVVPITTGGTVYGLIHLLSVEPGARFDDDDLQLVFDVGRRAGQAVRNAQLFERERQISTKLQASLLPSSLPHHPSIQLAARYRPGDEDLDVGGDWYDAFFVDEHRLVVTVGDVVGGGLPAASATGQLRSAVRALARRCDGPAQVLSELDAFAAAVSGADVATLAFVELDVTTGAVRYACAGHPPPLVIDASGSARYLDGGRSTPFVTVAEPRRVEAADHLDEGATLFLFTDGLFERRGETIDDGLGRLADVASTRIRAATLDTMIDQVVQQQLGEQGASDDLCVVAVARPLLDPLRFRRVMSARNDRLAPVRADLRGWLGGHEVDGAAIDDVLLAVFEAAANSVEHAYHGRRPGTVTIDARLDGDDVVVEVHDQGSWRLPVAPGERGRGTGLMHAVMDSAEVIRAATGTRVVLRRKVRSAVG